MAYRFKLDESLTRGVRRIALAQLAQAEQCLTGASDPVAAVHEARKSLKRVRALLRLVRPALREKVYRRENARLRDAARLLAPIRDKDVMRDTVAKLEERLTDNRKGCVAPLRNLLNGAAMPATGRPLPEVRKAKAALASARKRFARLPVATEGIEQVMDGLHASYRGGRRALVRAQDRANDEDFHELRKAVQQHWRQMLLLSRAWPEVCRARATAAREVAQLLGEEHDFAVLAAFARTHGNGSLGEEDCDAITEACRARQGELRAQSLPMARRLFAERAGPFTRQMAECWAAARDLARVHNGRPEQDD